MVKRLVISDFCLSTEDVTWTWWAELFHETWGIGFPKKTQVKMVESDKFTVLSSNDVWLSLGGSNPSPLSPFGPTGPGGPIGPWKYDYFYILSSVSKHQESDGKIQVGYFHIFIYVNLLSRYNSKSESKRPGKYEHCKDNL